MSKEIKPPLRYEQQIKLLKERDLIISDEELAQKILSHVNYYRLSAYGLGLRENDVFNENISFTHIYQLYEFDTDLRYMLFQLIEIIEITLRTNISYHIAFKYGPLSYLDSNNFVNSRYHEQFVQEFEREKYWQRNTAFVKHHNDEYGGKMPIWAACELFSFGMLSKLYSNMKYIDKKIIAEIIDNGSSQYPIDPDYLKSWLVSLVNLRNICAHYGRIYNRMLTGSPKLYKEHANIRQDRVFAVLLVIKRLLYDRGTWSTFVTKLESLIETYDVVNLHFIGFPDQWERILRE